MTKYRKKYLDYLESEHWKQLRARKIALHPTCLCCVTPASLEVHHVNYHNFYDCTVEDLVTLCEACHKLLHRALKYYKAKVTDYPAEKIGALIDRFRTEAPNWFPKERVWKERSVRLGGKKDKKAFSKACRRVFRKMKQGLWTVERIREMIRELESLISKYESHQKTGPA